jgi:chemotaxis protein methyltransferase CheR
MHRQTDSRALSRDNFLFACELMQREAAIVIGEGKEYLVETRLGPLAERNSYPSVNAFLDYLRFSGPNMMPMHREVIDALTINETLFFRDFHPFEALRSTVIPSFLAARPDGRLRIWSAACSTGQETYSLAILFEEHFPDIAANVQIIGTDLCTTVLRRARTGLFQQLEVNRGLPAHFLVKFFAQQEDGWQIREQIRRRVEFRELNLAKSWPSIGSFDLILIRNVMIYFDLPTRKKILDQARALLAPGGLLLLGGAETPFMVAEGYAAVSVGRTTFYKSISYV